MIFIDFKLFNNREDKKNLGSKKNEKEYKLRALSNKSPERERERKRSS